MAKMKRTRRGLGGAELSETLGSLLRSTIEQAGVVRDVLERGARTGRARIDEARAERRRSTALAELGEIVLELVRSGEVELSELPEIGDVVAELDRIDADGEGDGESLRDRAPASRAQWQRSRDDQAEWHTERSRSVTAPARPPMERRTEARAPVPAAGRERVWRPDASTPIMAPTNRDRSPRVTQPESLAARVRREADGTISALRHAGHEPATDAAHEERQLSYGNAPRGGISFDDDLQDYMHPDDVPGGNANDKE